MKDETIIAYKGNLTQEFTRVSWDILGTDKYGWSLIPEVPKEVREAMPAISADEQTASSEQPAIVIKEDVLEPTKPAEKKQRGRRKK